MSDAVPVTADSPGIQAIRCLRARLPGGSSGIIKRQADHRSHADDQRVFIGIEKRRVIGRCLIGGDTFLSDAEHQVKARYMPLKVRKVFRAGDQGMFVDVAVASAAWRRVGIMRSSNSCSFAVTGA